MECAKGMANLGPLLVLAFGGGKAIRGAFLISLCEHMLLSFGGPCRNLAERCPGEQTNNRAELIVSVPNLKSPTNRYITGVLVSLIVHRP